MRRWALDIIAAILAWLLLLAVARSEWVQIPPSRHAAQQGILGEIESRMPAVHIYRDRDIVTWAHETEHGLNSRIRCRYQGHVNAAYIPGGLALVLPEPPVTLGEVARAIPPADRGPVYSLYLVEQRRYWDREPLYLVDELSAYTIGAAVGIEHGLTRRAAESLAYAAELRGYALVMAALARQRGYSHAAELDSALAWWGQYHEQLRGML